VTEPVKSLLLGIGLAAFSGWYTARGYRRGWYSRVQVNKGQTRAITREGNRIEFLASVWCGVALTALGVFLVAMSVWQMMRPQDF
jgi:hypothetical protein